MKLHCATCGATIPAEDVNLDTGLARCRPCDEVFDVKALQAYQEEARPREPVPMPRGYSVVDDINGMIITRRWFNWGIIALLIFCCFWDGFLVVWYTIAFTEDSPLIMKIFPIGHLAVGAALTYCVIAGLFNRTKIDVDYDRVIVRHGPIPCFGNKRVDAVNVQQAYVKRSSYQVNNRHRWNVMIETADRSSWSAGCTKRSRRSSSSRSSSDFWGSRIVREN